MNRKQLVEREQRLGRIAGILGIAGVLFWLVPIFTGLGADFNKVASDAYEQRIEAFEMLRDDILLAQILQAVSLLLFIPGLMFLFDAAANRSETVRRALIGLCVIGPICVAASFFLYFMAYDSVVTTVLDHIPAGVDANEFAKDQLTGESAYSIFGGLQIAGMLATVVAVVYTALQAMRVGLLTRFVGTLGMAFGAGFILIGPISLVAFMVMISPLIAGWWRGPRPPAWDAGEAIPWPKPGDTPPDEPEELADPNEFEDGDGDGLPDGPSERPARRDNKKKRKRKQRS